MAPQDYYRILGVDQHAEAKKIKEAYRELAFKYHPDRNEKNPNSSEMMKSVNEAYAVLSNSEKRRAYDAMRRRLGDNAYNQFRNTYTEQDIFKGSDVHEIFEEMARSFGLRGVDAIFSDFYGSGYKRFTFRQHGLHGSGFIYRGGFGGRRGKGMTSGTSLGMGRFARYLLQKATGVRLPQMGQDIRDTIHLNPEFAKSGGPYPYHHIRRSKKLVVSIPAGTKDGQQIRLSQMGAAGKNGGPNGDLYLKVKFKKPLLEKAKDFIVSAFSR
jgi:DnaJ-class molecular chaperone